MRSSRRKKKRKSKRLVSFGKNYKRGAGSNFQRPASFSQLMPRADYAFWGTSFNFMSQWTMITANAAKNGIIATSDTRSIEPILN